MKLNKKGEALGTGDKQAEAALRNKAQEWLSQAAVRLAGHCERSPAGVRFCSVFLLMAWMMD